jgi:hypothetical protein
MDNEYVGYIYLTTFPKGSFETSENITPYYFGKHIGGDVDSYYFGSGTIVRRWFHKNVHAKARHCNPLKANAHGVFNTPLVFARDEKELMKLEAFFINPNVGSVGCLNIAPVHLDERPLTKEEGAIVGSHIAAHYDEHPEKRELIGKMSSESWGSFDRRKQSSKAHVDLWKNPVFKKEQIDKHKGLVWWTNDKENRKTRECPGNGWRRGRNMNIQNLENSRRNRWSGKDRHPYDDGPKDSYDMFADF